MRVRAVSVNVMGVYEYIFDFRFSLWGRYFCRATNVGIALGKLPAGYAEVASNE